MDLCLPGPQEKDRRQTTLIEIIQMDILQLRNGTLTIRLLKCVWGFAVILCYEVTFM